MVDSCRDRCPLCQSSTSPGSNTPAMPHKDLAASHMPSLPVLWLMQLSMYRPSDIVSRSSGRSCFIFWTTNTGNLVYKQYN
jgi:hypothetical protein